MFAKLFETSQGQLLIQKFDGRDDDNYQYELVLTYNVEPPFEGVDAVITTANKFGDTDEAEANRDKVFDEFDQGQADALVAKGFE